MTNGKMTNLVFYFSVNDSLASYKENIKVDQNVQSSFQRSVLEQLGCCFVLLDAVVVLLLPVVIFPVVMMTLKQHHQCLDKYPKRCILLPLIAVQITGPKKSTSVLTIQSSNIQFSCTIFCDQGLRSCFFDFSKTDVSLSNFFLLQAL